MKSPYFSCHRSAAPCHPPLSFHSSGSPTPRFVQPVPAYHHSFSFSSSILLDKSLGRERIRIRTLSATKSFNGTGWERPSPSVAQVKRRASVSPSTAKRE